MAYAALGLLEERLRSPRELPLSELVLSASGPFNALLELEKSSMNILLLSASAFSFSLCAGDLVLIETFMISFAC